MIKITYDNETGMYVAVQACDYLVKLEGKGASVAEAVEALIEDGRRSHEFYVHMEKVVRNRIADAEAMLSPATAVAVDGT